jgi:hypothetical protein
MATPGQNHPEGERDVCGALPRPLHCDWAWRAGPWREALSPPRAEAVETGSTIGTDVSLHHDGTASHVAYAQSARSGGMAPFALTVQSPGFDGSYLSLAVDLPAGVRNGLRQTHLIGLHLALIAARPPELFFRLNIQHGPNLTQATVAVPAELQRPDGALVEFDLAYHPFNERRVEQIWCDVILGGDALSEVTLVDACFTRRPRAAM